MTLNLDEYESPVLVVSTPADLLSQAIEKGLDIEKLQKLMDMQDKWEAKQARKAFMAAMAKFQSIVPVLMKDHTVDYTYKEKRTTYKHATLGSINAQIKEPLAECGLNVRWETTEADQKITLICVVSHLDGHSERNSMSGASDPSGGKNAIQAIGSTMTYLQRYTLIGALGLSTADEDNDGAKPKPTIAAKKKELKAMYGLKKHLVPDDNIEYVDDALQSDQPAALNKCYNYLKSL